MPRIDQFDTAAEIAAYTALLGFYSQSGEPAHWCIQMLPVAAAENHRLLGLLLQGASISSISDGEFEHAQKWGEAGISHAEAAGFREPAWYLGVVGLVGALIFTGQVELWLEHSRRHDSERDTFGQCRISEVWALAYLGRHDEAIPRADAVLADAERRQIPWTSAYASAAAVKAYSKTDPERALALMRRAVAMAATDGNPFWEAVFRYELAGLEASHGSAVAALDSFRSAIDSFARSGDTSNLSASFGYLAILLHRLHRSAEAATLIGAATRAADIGGMVEGIDAIRAAIAEAIGDQALESNIVIGHAMSGPHAINYAREQILTARTLATTPP